MTIRQMHDNSAVRLRLNGRRSIMRHLDIKSTGTWWRYKRRGMPLQYHGSVVSVLVSELNAWLAQQPCRNMRANSWSGGRAFAPLAATETPREDDAPTSSTWARDHTETGE